MLLQVASSLATAAAQQAVALVVALDVGAVQVEAQAAALEQSNVPVSCAEKTALCLPASSLTLGNGEDSMVEVMVVQD